MAEPRVRISRQKGQLNFGPELEALLHAFGAPTPPSSSSLPTTSTTSLPPLPTSPYPETLRILDTIVTDFLIELSHSVARTAHHSGRQKIKTEDVYFALRKDPVKLARVQEMLIKDKQMKSARKAVDPEQEARNEAENLVAVAEEAGVGEEGRVKGPGRGRRRKIVEVVGGGGGEGDGGGGEDAVSEAGKSKKSRTSRGSGRERGMGR